MTDPVLTVLTQIEIDLQTLVIPDPVPPLQIPQPGQADYPAWQAQTNDYKTKFGAPAPKLGDIKTLLTALYNISFVHDIGSNTIPPLIDEVRNLIVEIADKLGVVGAAVTPASLDGLKTFLEAIQKLPGSPPALADATNALTTITGLLGDIPSAQNELYMIAQQLQVFSGVFSNPAAP